jgi:hypothetical protein
VSISGLLMRGLIVGAEPVIYERRKERQALAWTDADSEENKGPRNVSNASQAGRLSNRSSWRSACYSFIKYHDEDGKVKELALFGTNIANCR